MKQQSWPIILLTIVNVMQSVGDMTGTTVGGFDREPTAEELSGGILASGVVTLIGACFGGLPVSSYSQNVKYHVSDKVVCRKVFGVTATIVMLVLGFSPKFSALMSTMPKAVIGGATIIVFGMITITGMRLLKDDLSFRNGTIAGLALALGNGYYNGARCNRRISGVYAYVFNRANSCGRFSSIFLEFDRTKG